MKKKSMEHKDIKIKDRDDELNKSEIPCNGWNKSERGAVLLVTLVLSAIAIMVTAALIVLVTTGTQMFGEHARYRDARQAAKGCADVFMQLVETRGDGQDLTDFQNSINANNAYITNLNVATPLTCTTTVAGKIYTRLAAKLMAPQTVWPADCNTNANIDPADITTYDMSATIGTTTRFNCYAKLTSNTEGNTGGKAPLHTKGVVNTGDSPVMPVPFYYAIEVLSQPVNFSDARGERSRLSILFQY